MSYIDRREPARERAGRLDTKTGLYHFRHRDLNPIFGRWIQQDPLGYVDGLNLYQSEHSSPINYLDPLGLRGSTTQPSNKEIAVEIVAGPVREIAVDEIGKATGKQAAATAVNATVTIIQGGAMLPELARPAAATGAKNRLIEVTLEGKDPNKDALFNALDKLANGGKFGDLTPAEKAAYDEHMK